MSKTYRYPRNEQARRDRIAQHEIVKIGARNEKTRDDLIANNPYGNPAIALALSGTAITGGVTESEIVAGGETLILTLSGGIQWRDEVGDDNAFTTALIAGITGDDAGSTGWDDEVTIAHGNVERTSDTVVTITLPAAGSYAITADETVTVAVPASVVTKGVAPASKTFDISNEA